MSISEHKHMPEPVMEVFTGAGRRRSWSAAEIHCRGSRGAPVGLEQPACRLFAEACCTRCSKTPARNCGLQRISVRCTPSIGPATIG